MKKMLLGVFIGVLFNCVAISAKDENPDLENLISRHLRAVGPEAAIAAVKTRVAEGVTHYRVITGGTADLDGKAALVSEGARVRVLLRIPDQRYPGENFVTDGKRVQVFNMPRSNFGELTYSEEALLRDGLLGGVLTTAWPFYSPDKHQAKLTYGGLVDIDGKKLHLVKYTPKKRSELNISLYFDPDTARHVLSVYTVEIAPRLISSTDAQNPEVANSAQQTVRYKLEERFGEFREVDNLTLPTEWKIRLDVEGFRSAVMTWEIKFDRLVNNLTLDPRNFPMK